MRTVNTQEYRVAPGGDGPHANQWKDKPHRLIYDLCSEVDRLRTTADYEGDVEQLVEALFRIRELTKGEKRLQLIAQIAHQAVTQGLVEEARGMSNTTADFDFKSGKIVKLKPRQDIVKLESGELVIATFLPGNMVESSRDGAHVALVGRIDDVVFNVVCAIDGPAPRSEES